MGTQQPIRKVVTPEIPDKLYFRIGDVARLCEVPTYVLRFWETEFPQLKPNKGGTGQRLYRRRDVELALRIKSLLYDQGYTIPGARQVFKNEAAARSASQAEPAVLPVPATSTEATSPALEVQDSGAVLRQRVRLGNLREEMAALLAMLSEPPAGEAPAAERQALGRPEPKVQAMRPRLVLEPRTSLKRGIPEGFGSSGMPKLQLAQRDLFAGAPADEEWPEPPPAS